MVKIVEDKKPKHFRHESEEQMNNQNGDTATDLDGTGPPSPGDVEVIHFAHLLPMQGWQLWLTVAVYAMLPSLGGLYFH